jgi:hypothetical protein
MGIRQKNRHHPNRDTGFRREPCGDQSEWSERSVTRDGDHTISVLSINGDKVRQARLRGTETVRHRNQRGRSKRVVAHLGLGRGDNDTISLIDLTLNPPRVTETYTVGQTPEGINISPDGKLVAVVTMNGSNKPKISPFYSTFGRVLLFRLNRGALKLVSDARIGTWPQGAAFSADGKTLLVQSMDERNIMVFSIDEAYRLNTGQRIPLQGGRSLRGRQTSEVRASRARRDPSLYFIFEQAVGIRTCSRRARLSGRSSVSARAAIHSGEAKAVIVRAPHVLPFQNVVERVAARPHGHGPEADLTDAELVPPSA